MPRKSQRGFENGTRLAKESLQRLRKRSQCVKKLLTEVQTMVFCICKKSLDRGFKDRSGNANKVSAYVQNKVATCLDCHKRGSRLGLDLERTSQQKSKTSSQYAGKY
jgi:hypothetical protein